MINEIPGLGPVTKDESFGWYYSQELEVKVLGGIWCRVTVEGYDEDPGKVDFHVAIRNFLAADQSVLKEAEPFIYQYYRDMNSNWSPENDGYVRIVTAQDVWAHIRLGKQPMVSRRPYGDRMIYVSLECECDWEPEHGLQIVFKDGLKVNKVGQYDGHLTNSDAYADDSLEEVVYRTYA